jgi:hypothetical protein
MAKYFNYFPKTFYTSNNSTTGLDSVTNIIARFAFENKLKENSSAFYKYNIKDSDTPEIIAYKFYGSVERQWVVLLFNDIIDPQFDWPFESNQLITYIDKKYTANGAANTTVQSGLAWALSENNVQSYFKVITSTANDGTITTEKITIDANTYANVTTGSNTYTTQAGESVRVVTTKETQSYYTYETNLNESKREINLIKSDFLPQIEKEFKRVVRL